MEQSTLNTEEKAFIKRLERIFPDLVFRLQEDDNGKPYIIYRPKQGGEFKILFRESALLTEEKLSYIHKHFNGI